MSSAEGRALRALRRGEALGQKQGGARGLSVNRRIISGEATSLGDKRISWGASLVLAREFQTEQPRQGSGCELHIMSQSQAQGEDLEVRGGQCFNVIEYETFVDMASEFTL